jgi:hypothetical protein
MIAKRGLSQILFGYLPEQTVDLAGGIWKVRRWIEAREIRIDTRTVREELTRAIEPWALAKRDGNLSGDLFAGKPIRVIEVNPRRGAEVDRFPRVYRCQVCSRLEESDGKNCKCGKRAWAHWHFVSYHDCGYVGPPKFNRCPKHGEVAVRLPGTAAAADLRFYCPVCTNELHKNFAFRKCTDCNGDELLRHDVHRAAGVYSAQTLTLVNPPDEKTADSLRMPGANFLDQGFDETTARALVDRMIADGQIDVPAVGGPELSPDVVKTAGTAAVNLWLAASGQRTTFDGLRAEGRLPAGYERACAAAGVRSIDLLTDFPVLTARYGYTRGSSRPGEATLRGFRDRQNQIAIHGQMSRTEGLLIRLDPLVVAQWLVERGHPIEVPSNRRSAHELILADGVFPGAFDEPQPDIASDVLTLVHTMSHRLVRQIANRAGLDREAIAEYLVPEHMAFVLYAASRGDFVLGGMQALFENDLDLALNATVEADLRCALDPGCKSHGGACAACLHLGEPSCRLFNRFLDRATLGPSRRGYFAVAARETATV